MVEQLAGVQQQQAEMQQQQAEMQQQQAATHQVLAEMQQQLSGVQQQQAGMQQQLAGVQQQQAGMQQQLAGVQQQQAGMQKQLDAVQASTSRTEARLGHLFEADVRTSVASSCGTEYAKPALVKSLHDLASLLPLGKVDVTNAAEKASRVLVDANMPLKLLHVCERVALRRAEQRGAEAAACCEKAGKWVGEDSSVRVEAMEACLSACGDTALATLARKLRKAVGESPEEQVADLRSDDGPGLACLLAASRPAAAGGADDDDLPGESFQLDASGRREFRDDGAVLMADVGEIKSSMNYATAVPQLGRALCALRWMAATCCGCDAARAQLTGRLFVPHSQVVLATADAQQVALARRVYGFQLHVHAL